MPEKKPFPFRIGSDPEFNIVLQNKRVSAERLFNIVFEKQFEAVDKGYKLDKIGVIGWDGNTNTAELRPTPTHKPETLVINLRKMFEKIVEHIQLFELSTLSDKASVGGHLHFELPDTINTSNQKLNAIHKKICSFYIPLMLGEDNFNLRIRTKQNYGKLNDYRTEMHDFNKYTYEFRVPSAEWLTTEKVAKATIAYLATVYNEILHHPSTFRKCTDVILKTEKQGNALQELASSQFAFITDTLTKKIKGHIKNFEFYPQYKEEIEYILNPEKVLKDKRKVNFNIIEGWKLIEEKAPTKKMLLNNKKVEEKSLKIDLDRLAEAIDLSYNPDTNVQEFVRTIKSRIIAMNWKLKNFYYLFGLRKGIGDYIIVNKNNQYLYGQNQLKTADDIGVIEGTFKKMNEHFIMSETGTTKPNKNNNYEKETANKYILIGIPYDLRIKNQSKTIIEKIHDIENNKFKPEELVKDINKLEPNPGKIAQIYNKRNPEDAVIDVQYDRAQERARQAVIETRMEIAVEENEIRQEGQINTTRHQEYTPTFTEDEDEE
jgi:hypothetical protein